MNQQKWYNIPIDTESDHQMIHMLTPDEFVVRAVNKYPALYATSSYDDVKFKVLDHTFNTIGNGVYMEHFAGEPVTQEEIAAAQKWFKCSRAAYGYMKTNDRGHDGIEVPPEARQLRIESLKNKNTEILIETKMTLKSREALR